MIGKRFGVELKNPGVADVAVRGDCKIMASGGWDGRYIHYTLSCCFYLPGNIGFGCLGGRRVNPWQY